MRYQGKKPKKSTEKPDLYTFAVVKTGTIVKSEVMGYTVTRSEFRMAVESALVTLSKRFTDPLVKRVREIVEPTAETIDRFPLGEWISPTRGCGCIVGEALVAADAINRYDFMKLEHGSPFRLENGAYDVYSLIEHAYDGDIDLANALYSFGNDVDLEVRALLPGDRRRASEEDKGLQRVVFIEDAA